MSALRAGLRNSYGKGAHRVPTIRTVRVRGCVVRSERAAVPFSSGLEILGLRSRAAVTRARLGLFITENTSGISRFGANVERTRAKGRCR